MVRVDGVSVGGNDTATRIIGHLLRRWVDPELAYVLIGVWMLYAASRRCRRTNSLALSIQCSAAS